MEKKFNKYIKKFENTDIDIFNEDDWDFEEEVIKKKGYKPKFTKNTILYFNPIFRYDGSVNSIRYINNKYRKQSLKTYLKNNGKIPCIVQEDLNSGFAGSDVPEHIVKFEITQNIIENLNDKECIGFNSNLRNKKSYFKNRSSDDYIDQEIYNLEPLYRKEYIWEYNDKIPLQHIRDTKETLKVYKEDWEMFITMFSKFKKKYTWCAHRKWKPPTIKEINIIFKKQEYVYIWFSSCLLPHYTIKGGFGKYIVNFKDLLNNDAIYIKKSELK